MLEYNNASEGLECFYVCYPYGIHLFKSVLVGQDIYPLPHRDYLACFLTSFVLAGSLKGPYPDPLFLIVCKILSFFFNFLFVTIKT
jgi:hypothetical protein